MTKITKFEINLTDKITIKGEYEGNTDSKQAIVFSHGFGVRREETDNLFVDIGNVLKSQYLIIRFDYNIVDREKNTNFIHPYSIQAKMLRTVIEYTKNTLQQDEISLIGHSAGCVVICLADPSDIKKTIFLTPPVSSIHSLWKERFSKRTGANINEHGISSIPRSDGTTSLIPADFWQGLEAIKPYQLFLELAKKTDLYIIRALEDNVLDDTYDEIKNAITLKYIELHGDHNFTGIDRIILSNIFREIFI